MKQLLSTYDIAKAAGLPTYGYASWAPNSEESMRLYHDVLQYEESPHFPNVPGFLCWTPEGSIAYAYSTSDNTLAFSPY